MLRWHAVVVRSSTESAVRLRRHTAVVESGGRAGSTPPHTCGGHGGLAAQERRPLPPSAPPARSLSPPAFLLVQIIVCFLCSLF